MKPRVVEVELFSYCNRQCSWCPNKNIDRKTCNNYLDWETFEALIQELKAVDYDGYISFSRYNEPLVNPDLIKKACKLIYEELPKAKPVTNTNGDFLRYESFDLGIFELTVMDYDSQGSKLIKEKLLSNGFNITSEDYPYIFFERFASPTKGMYVLDWPKHAKIVSRGGSIETKEKELRTTPCFEPTHFVGIDYNGNVMPCCELRSDNPDHKSYVLGNIIEDNIFDILKSPRAVAFRNSVAEGELLEVCKYCQKCPGRYTRDNARFEYK